jgi:hypothetical protein
MKPASIDDIKKELKELPPKKLLELTLRLARFKKENKELLTYLLFEAGDEAGYIQSLQLEIDELFSQVAWTPTSNAKKQLRRILRTINRQIKYIGSKSAAVELMLHFSSRLKENQPTPSFHPKLFTIFSQQLAKAEKLLPAIDDDLQYDYEQRIIALRGNDFSHEKPAKKRWWKPGRIS